MTPRRRDPKGTRRFREGPESGRRFVDRGKVRIEWREGDRRRRKTIGNDTMEMRKQADAELLRILRGLHPTEPPAPTATLAEDLRGVALQILDVADEIAERLQGDSTESEPPQDTD